MKNMIYLDSNVFIFTFLAGDKKTELCKSILTNLSELDSACTSILTWNEVSWIARKRLGIQDGREQGKKFLECSFVKLFDITELVAVTAQSLVEKYGLKPHNSIHAATAILNGIKEIISDDPDFDKVKEIKRIPIEKFKPQ